MSKIVLDSTHLRPATMANAREAISLDNINMEIFTVISDLVRESLAKDPEHKEYLASFYEVIGSAQVALSRDQLAMLEDAPFRLSESFGTAMFLLGLQIGRDPMSLLTLGGER
jgi:hypothetical protein